MTRRTLMTLMPVCAAGQAAIAAAVSAGEYNGRWNIKLDHPRGRVWWLEVSGAGTPQMGGWFVGVPGGQVDRITEIRMAGEGIEFVFIRQREGQQLRQVYSARLAGGVLEGELKESLGETARPVVKWTGYRAPVIKDSDDGGWVAGETVKLFDGASLAGWKQVLRGAAPGWRVEEGLLRNGQGASDLVSEAKFWNFILKAEYRYGKGSNSGMALRGRYEIQIYDDHGRPADTHGHGALYSRHAALTNASKPAGEWQSLEVRLVGRELTAHLNGVKIHDRRVIDGATAMATDADEDKPGPIGIQGDHGLIEFRKIEVTNLERKR